MEHENLFRFKQVCQRIYMRQWTHRDGDTQNLPS